MRDVVFICIIISQTLLGQTWQSIGPEQGINQRGDSLHSMGYVSGIWRNPANNQEIILSTNSSGIWKTTNRGFTWKSVTDKKALIPGMGSQSFSQNPSNENELLAAAANYVYGNDNYKGRVLISNDKGDSWRIWESFEHPKDDEIIKLQYLTAQDILVVTKTRVYYTDDHGKSWETIFELKKELSHVQHEFQFLNDFIVFDNKNILLTSQHRWGNTGQVWRTNNLGKEWEDITSTVANDFDFVYAARLSEIHNDQAVLGITDAKTVKLFNITENGYKISYIDQFRTNYKTGDAKASKFEIEYSKINPNKIYLGFVEFFEWTKENGLVMLSASGNISKNEHDDVRYMEVYTENDNEYVLMGNDGGISLYDPQKKSFQSLNGKGLSTLQVYKLGVSQKQDYELIIGTQDNGTFMYDNTQKSWTWIDGGDGGPSWLSEDGDKYVYAINGSVRYKEKEDRFKSQYFTPAKRNSGWFLDFPVEVDHKEENIHIGSSKAGTSKGATLYIENIKDKSKSIATEIERLGAIGSIAVASQDKQTVFVASNDYEPGNSNVPRLLKSFNRGKRFEDLSSSTVYGSDRNYTLKEILDYRTISDIEIDPHDNSIIFLSLTGYNKDLNGFKPNYYRILQSSDGGETWDDITNGLPTNYPVYKIIRHAGAELLTFCGTDDGVYYRSKEQKKWTKFGEGFPLNTTVTDLQINYITQEVFAATFGRGVWKTQVPLFRTHEESIKDTLSNPTKVIKSDIRVKSNETLVIDKNLILANNVSIILAPKSTLIIDRATIKKGNTNDLTPSLIIEEKKYLFFFKRKKGTVEYKNNGTIK